MTGRPAALAALADAVLLPGFDGTTAPDWVRRRVGESLGGVCLFARNIIDADGLRRLTDTIAAERADVIIAVDEEAGDVTRLDAATGSRFPGAAALGRVDDVGLTRMIGYQVGVMLAEGGITLNLAPCADVAVDPLNPVIGTRSFGADPDLVARHTAAFVAGHQLAGVPACAKHFPGHGDTDTDTHRQIAVLDGDWPALLAEAIPPFEAALDAGVAAIMAGHLLVPSVDPEPATISRRWLAEILRQEMGFTGLIVTDALEMAAIADTVGIVDGAVLALAAGADLLCLGGEHSSVEFVDELRRGIVAAVRSGELSEERLADAAARCAALGRTAAPPPAGFDPAASAAVAWRALAIAGPLPELGDPVLVVQCEPAANIAVGSIPWGPAPALGSARSTRLVTLHDGEAVPTDTAAGAGSVLLVTRNRHRHPWMSRALAALRAVRPDTVLVEMGSVGVDATDRPAVATFGATAANAAAAADALVTRGSGRR